MEATMTPAAHAMQEKFKNNRTLRDVRREMGKFCVDYSKVTLGIRRGTLSIFGRITPLRGHESVFEDEYKALIKAIQTLPDIHQVVLQ
jgi:hypothetical protein